MNETLMDAHEELKRVDHLVYVSLKYTRTVDVILNILNRMIDGYSYMIDVLLEKAREEKKMVPDVTSALEKAETARKLYEDDVAVVDNIDLYLLLRKLLRAKHIERENEYRRHVTMKTVIDGREEIVNIDIVTNYFIFQREFLDHLYKKFGIEMQRREDVMF